MGNVLVVDRDNCRMLVFNDQGQYITEAEMVGDLPQLMQNIRKIGDYYYIAHRYCKDHCGGILKLQLSDI